MQSQDIISVFKQTHALLEGHFLLSSGMHSPQYLQCALVLQDPKISGQLCGFLAAQFKKANPDVVIAPALGGVIVAYEVARALGIKGIFAERKEGKMCLKRGFLLSEKDKVLVVEDVITTGRSTREVIDIVKKRGAHIIGVGCIADRSKSLLRLGIEYKSLVKLDIPTFNPDECPLCKENMPLVKPGSRGIKK